MASPNIQKISNQWNGVEGYISTARPLDADCGKTSVSKTLQENLFEGEK